MRKKYLVLLLLILGSIGCKKDSNKTDTTPEPGYTVFKNQTGDPGANALQAQLNDADRKEVISFYGTFDTDGNPSQLRSITYQKEGNDTVVHMLTNTANNKVETMYFEVKGVKQPYVMKFLFFPGNDSSFRFSMYTYDWATEASTLQFETMVFSVNGEFFNDPLYGNFKLTGFSWKDMAHFSSVSLGIIRLVLLQALFQSIPEFIPALTGMQSVWMYLMVAIYQTQLASLHLATANPAPAAKSYPSNTPASNPSSDPTPKLGASPCANTSISFFADLDEQGKVTINDVWGGQAPYTYSGSGFGGFQSNATLPGTYERGKEYTFTVKDSKGCMGSLTMMWPE